MVWEFRKRVCEKKERGWTLGKDKIWYNSAPLRSQDAKNIFSRVKRFKKGNPNSLPVVCKNEKKWWDQNNNSKREKGLGVVWIS